jgi:5,10-methylenetetrahydrofolate reductase
VPGEFEVICEIEPATRPDLVRVRQQIGVLSAITSRFLIPDNHIGRATVSSIAVAHEVALMGGRAVACLNARDRNVLGFRRDMLTAAAYGVDEFLFVYGDRPETGRRSDDLTVRAMLDHARTFDEGLRLGVSTRLTVLPTWKREADFLFVQVSFSLDHLLAWRRDTGFDGPVYAGVMVVPSPGRARKLMAEVPQLAVPPTVVEALEADPAAGVKIACDLVRAIRDSGDFDGVHLIPINRASETVRQLQAQAAL